MVSGFAEGVAITPGSKLLNNVGLWFVFNMHTSDNAGRQVSRVGH